MVAEITMLPVENEADAELIRALTKDVRGAEALTLRHLRALASCQAALRTAGANPIAACAGAMPEWDWHDYLDVTGRDGSYGRLNLDGAPRLELWYSADDVSRFKRWHSSLTDKAGEGKG